jgi:hypothetical protein
LWRKKKNKNKKKLKIKKLSQHEKKMSIENDYGVKPHQVYKHYKTEGQYMVIIVATSTDTLERYVIYKQLGASKTYPKGHVWSRKLDEFVSMVTHKGKEMNRFTFEYDDSWFF